MAESKKERMQGNCPICGYACFLSETKSGNEYSFFCKTGKHRGFIAREEDIPKLFQIKEVSHGKRSAGTIYLLTRVVNGNKGTLLSPR